MTFYFVGDLLQSDGEGSVLEGPLGDIWPQETLHHHVLNNLIFTSGEGVVCGLRDLLGQNE